MFNTDMHRPVCQNCPRNDIAEPSAKKSITDARAPNCALAVVDNRSAKPPPPIPHTNPPRNNESVEPHRVKLRIDNADPRQVASSTESEDPSRAQLLILTVEPASAKSRHEMALPNRVKLLMLILEEISILLTTLNCRHEPIAPRPNKLQFDAMRAADRRLNVDPKLANSSALQCRPTRRQLRMDTLDPKLTKSRTEAADPCRQ
jgi:hypothetical protein